jgi:hypothetical protein
MKTAISLVILALVSAVCSGSDVASASTRPIIERLQPAPKDAGFRMKGYFVWGGSLIRVGSEYHLFASRWPTETRFPQGYRDHSQIVRATAKTPIGPYTFREVVVAGRGGAWWDGKMCHNPKIVQAGDTYVLYYIGSAPGSGLRKCGYAWSKSITGPWTRREEPLPFGEDHNNPAPYIHDDGKVLVAFRDRQLNMFIATANAFDGAYEIAARNLFPFKVEDPDLFFAGGQFHMVAEDNVGGLTGAVRHGAHLVSENGLQWQPADPVTVYDHTLRWTGHRGRSTRAPGAVQCQCRTQRQWPSHAPVNRRARRRPNLVPYPACRAAGAMRQRGAVSRSRTSILDLSRDLAIMAGLLNDRDILMAKTPNEWTRTSSINRAFRSGRHADRSPGGDYALSSVRP